MDNERCGVAICPHGKSVPSGEECSCTIEIKTYGTSFVSEGGEVAKEALDRLGRIVKKQCEETANRVVRKGGK